MCWNEHSWRSMQTKLIVSLVLVLILVQGASALSIQEFMEDLSQNTEEYRVVYAGQSGEPGDFASSRGVELSGSFINDKMNIVINDASFGEPAGYVPEDSVSYVYLYGEPEIYLGVYDAGVGENDLEILLDTLNNFEDVSIDSEFLILDDGEFLDTQEIECEGFEDRGIYEVDSFDSEIEDSCAGISMLLELSCESGVLETEGVECEFGCLDGVCLSERRNIGFSNIFDFFSRWRSGDLSFFDFRNSVRDWLSG
jgi:hypothetical protein